MAGRPSKAEQWLTEDGLSMLTHWKRNDLTDAEIAKRIGIKPPTLNDWKKRFPKISEALKKGFEYTIKDAEEALVSKFKVQILTEKKTEIWEDEDGKKKRHIVTTERQIAPDTTAIIFFLKAKAGWRDNTDLRKVAEGITAERRKELEEVFNAQSESDNSDKHNQE